MTLYWGGTEARKRRRINAEDHDASTNKKRPGRREPTVDELFAAIAKATPTSTRSRLMQERSARTSTTSRSGLDSAAWRLAYRAGLAAGEGSDEDARHHDDPTTAPEHAYLRGHKVRIIAVLKNAARRLRPRPGRAVHPRRGRPRARGRRDRRRPRRGAAPVCRGTLQLRVERPARHRPACFMSPALTT